MSADAQNPDYGSHRTALLPNDLTDEQFDEAPVLGSVDLLLIDGLSDNEDDAFAAALV